VCKNLVCLFLLLFTSGYFLEIVTHRVHIPSWFNAIYPFWPHMSLFDRCSKMFSWKQIAQRLDPRLELCASSTIYDNFPYDSVKTTCKLHVKIFIRHSPVESFASTVNVESKVYKWMILLQKYLSTPMKYIINKKIF
jgi:hypothetical protein